MSEKEFRDSIIEIWDKKTDEKINNDEIKVLKVINKYSNTKKPIYKFFIREKEISRNNSFVVKYKCISCKIINTITLNLFLRKIHKKILNCNICKNSDENKRLEQSLLMLKKYNSDIQYVRKEKVKIKSFNLNELIELSKKKWEEMDEDFKEKYYLKHLSLDEFDRIKDKIISINNDKIMNLDSFRYIPNFILFNQTQFNPVLINESENRYEKIIYIKYKCENCSNFFVNRDLYIQKNRIKIFCKDCNFTNKTFKIRKLKIDDIDINYQSNYEKHFIIWCKEKKIKISNGPTIKYLWNLKEHNYRIDFTLPDQKYLIELKDNHIWQKKDLNSGKFDAKKQSAEIYAKNIGFRYLVIFPKNMTEFKNKIIL